MDSVPCTTLASTHANGVDKQPNSSNELTAPMAIHATNTLLQDFSRPLHLAAIQIIEQFTLRTEYLQRITDHFLVELRRGLCDASLPFQLPAFVTTVPTGAETGKFLTVDLGGTNCRICLVELQGQGNFSVTQEKYAVPSEIMVNEKSEPLFDWLASLIQMFVAKHPHDMKNTADSTKPARTPLGFTFSFTCDQTSLSSGTLIHWDKGWDIPTAIGHDPCLLLQAALDSACVLVEVVVLANDSVGTLLARAYTAASENNSTSGVSSKTIASIIVGTGTNAAYVEQLSKIKRHPQSSEAIDADANLPSVMIMNSEWGCWDDSLVVLPQTKFDADVDSNSSNPGGQMFEKMASGMYLGELFRLAVCDLIHRGGVLGLKPVHQDAPLFQRDAINTSLLSALAEKDTSVAQKSILVSSVLGVEDVEDSDVLTLHAIAASITTRAARLTGAALAAILIQCEDNDATPKIPDHHGSTAKDLGSISCASQAGNLPATCTRRHWAVSRISKGFNNVTSGVRGFLSLCFPVSPSNRLGSSQFTKPFRTTSSSGEASSDEDTAEAESWVIDIGVTGSVIELHPTFGAEMLAAIDELPSLSTGRRGKLRTGLCSDGSAVGAALMAHAAILQVR